MKNKMIKVAQCMLFFSILGVLILAVRYICVPEEYEKSQIVLYAEQEENSIDIAFVGSSATYRYYDIMTIWDEYQITSMCYTTAGMPFDYTMDMIDMLLENQDPEIIVLDLRSLLNQEYSTRYYGTYETNGMKTTSLNVLTLFSNITQRFDIAMANAMYEGERYLYILDVLYYHTNFFDEIEIMQENNYELSTIDYKGNRMSYKVEDVSESYVDFSLLEEDESYVLTDEIIAKLEVLFAYIEENELNVYFTFTPYVGARNEKDQEIRRELGELVVEYGYPFKDFKEDMEIIGLDEGVDFYNDNHVNAFGAKKYTLYAMEYILEAYEIEADYEQEVVDEWNGEYGLWTEYSAKKEATLLELIEELE